MHTPPAEIIVSTIEVQALVEKAHILKDGRGESELF